jgi:diketogulonate reductase-like aldo/keto reductase
MSVNPAPTLTLANGVEMPQLGLGTWPIDRKAGVVGSERFAK